MGFLEVVRHYPKLRAIFNRACHHLKTARPDLLVCVDYPGFNLRLAAYAKSLNIPVLYYIAPKLWAWGAWRMKRLKRVVDRLAVIFPFETGFFGKQGIRTDYVGNPNIENFSGPGEAADAESASNLLGLLPGSRIQEVKRLLPDMVQAGRNLMATGQFEGCLVSKSAGLPDSLFTEVIGNDPRFSLHAGTAQTIFKRSRFLIIKSGTATLEAALHQKPFVVIYKLSPLSHFLANRVVKLDVYSMVNIVCEKAVVPELIQHSASADGITSAVLDILNNPAEQQSMLNEFSAMKKQLESMNPSQNTTNIIEEMLHG